MTRATMEGQHVRVKICSQRWGALTQNPWNAIDAPLQVQWSAAFHYTAAYLGYYLTVFHCNAVASGKPVFRVLG